MPTVIYQLKDGSERRIEVPSGQSVMLGAVQNNVPGIDAECGGCCACGTCHVYVDPAFYDRLPPPEAMEDDLLSGVAAGRQPTSRLSCQIAMAPSLDGLIVRMPERQG